jgi:hypothetical protein
MTKLSDHDWELINAFADGELSVDEAALMEQRIESEPELSEALDSVLKVSSALTSLKPEIATTAAAANATRRPWILVMGGSLAAALALVAVLSGGPVQGTALGAIHQAYLSQNFNVEAGSELQEVSGGFVDGFPILTDANLTLAVTKLGNEISSAHYVGSRGCRLTVLRGKGDVPTAPDNMQSTLWTAGTNWFLVLATGMDQPKFNTVSEFLRQSTLDRLGQNTVLAMQEAVSVASPCAIS